MPQAAIVPIITAAVGVAGTVVSYQGAQKQAAAARSQAEASQRIAEQQQKQNEVLQKQAALNYRRQQLEFLRSSQRARSLSLATATNQGAQYGSGLPGGLGQISGAYNTNQLGLSQNFALGQENFGINQNISQQRIAIAGFGADAAQGAGLASLGGALVKNAGTIGNLAGNFQGFGFGGGYGYNYGNPGGTGGGLGGLY